MLSNFFTVGEQILILFLLIAVGFVCGKKKMLTEKTVQEMTDFVLFIVAPCVIIDAFQRPFDAALSHSFFQAILFSTAAILIAFVLARFTLHHEDKKRESVYRFAVMFSNCAFMGFPLEQALLGADGLFFGAATLVSFTVLTWTLGLYVMSRDKSLLSLKKLLINPGIIGVVIGLALFFSSTALPHVVAQPVSYLAALNTPLPMVIIGYHLSRASILPILKDARTWITIGERLIVVPLIALGVGLLSGMNSFVLLACMVVTCPPTAANCTMFAASYKQDAELSVSLVSLSTLLSILTMPVIIVFTQFLCGISF